MRHLLITAAAVSTFATHAFAADAIYEPAPAPAPMEMAPVSSGWTGLYVGVQGGGAFNPSDPDNVDLRTNGFAFGGSAIQTAFGSNFDSSFDSSFAGGAHIGYDYQMGSIVLGALADINALNVSQTASGFSSTPAFYTATRDLDYLVTARLRAGYLVTPTALAYATGGLAYGKVDYGFSTNSPAVVAPNPGAIINEDEDDFGYTIGAGMEVLVTDNLSFAGEYLYTNLGSGDSYTRLSGGPFGGGVGGSTDFVSDDDFDFHTVTAKLSYKFH
ncbi:outer membrane beta-barrel protein [Jiella sp. CBK1P-4]|uniref:Outer membrane beta-barrel protein n=2 Tax=Jiella avicenniae TaxID=2907202 RepID=A0A9X1NYK6_9HYPH|nr:outer membrane beta-barrel protein [Jiella avicenniae]MCE7026684.1 outer membrane beta-barrel protein [Jiella avicenniae]